MLDVLVVLLLLASDATPDLPAEWKALRKAYGDAQDAAFAVREDGGGDSRPDKPRDPFPAFYPKFRDFAAHAKGTPLELEALEMILVMSQNVNDRAAAAYAVDAALASDLDADGLVRFVRLVCDFGWALDDGKAVASLRTVATKTRNENVRAAAKLSLAIRLLDEAQSEAVRDEPKAREARALFGEVVAKQGGTDHAEDAKRYLFEMDHLQIGMVAPDIDATDADGRKFKLSDYRGKVVVLNFWFWG